MLNVGKSGLSPRFIVLHMNMPFTDFAIIFAVASGWFAAVAFRKYINLRGLRQWLVKNQKRKKLSVFLVVVDDPEERIRRYITQAAVPLALMVYALMHCIPPSELALGRRGQLVKKRVKKLKTC